MPRTWIISYCSVRTKGKTHYEWQEQKKGQSWKAQMKSDMDKTIRESCSYEDFIRRMRSKGYTVKGETFGDNALKYLSFSASGQNRFTRVSEKNFGKGYTKEAIRERIENHVKTQNYSSVKKKVPFPKKPDSKRALIDTNNEKFQEILKYAKQYVENWKYQRGYEKAKGQDSYFRKHETQIILFGGAENMLKRYGIKAVSLNIEKIQAEYDAMAAQKVQLRKMYQMAEKDVAEADTQLKNIRQYLEVEKERQEGLKSKKKHEISL